MAFKLSYSFEGKHSTKPEQNLSGASKKLSRDVLLQKTHEERRKRQEQRLKVQSTEILQSHIRSYLARKAVKALQRANFDSARNETPLQDLLASLVFFYDQKQDSSRLNHLCGKLLEQAPQILIVANEDPRTVWLLRRWLVLCMKTAHLPQMSQLMLNCLDVFATNSHTIEYLIRKGLYAHLRHLLDGDPKQELIGQILTLIHRPFLYLRDSHESQELILSEFCKNFLVPAFSVRMKTDVIPYLRSQKTFPYEKILRYLNGGYHIESSNSLFYSILALEPDDYEPTIDTIQVLASKSTNTYTLKPSYSLVSDDSEDEENYYVSDEELFLSDFLRMLNKPERVRKWLHLFETNSDNENVLIALTKFCHNLLLVYKDSIRKYLLLYKLGLNGNFLNKLWSLLTKKRSIDIELKGSCLISWKECHTNLSVFCDMFTFYTETLTDSENSDTSETFSRNDLFVMSRLLKNVAIDLVEIAFPMCRASTIPATNEILHLYWSCLNCLKMLYMLDMRKQFCPSGFWTAKKIHVSPFTLKRNYLSKTIKPFYGIVADGEDEDHLPPLSTIEQRSLAILQQLPFLISFNTRVLLLRDLCRYSLGGDNDFLRMQHEFMTDGVVVIRRTHLYEDAFDKLSTINETDLKHKLRIRFINSAGLEEAGVDGGGIFKEFINETLKTAFDPNRGFFMMTADNTLYPNPNVHLLMENFTEHYYFIGRLVGKAIFANILVDLPLAEFFLAKLLVDRASAHYLKSLDPVLYRNLLYLRDYSGDVSDLGLDFTTVYNDLGETRVMELKPNGRNIQVTNENRLEYIQRLADLKLNAQLRKQTNAFREGLDNVVPLLWLRLFNHQELQVIIGGDMQEIDLSDLRAHTAYGGDFTPSHPTVILFWNVLSKFTEVQKKQLLKFVTSCSRPPLLGFKELNPPFCIQSAGTDDRMPTASTCLNLLKIPLIQEEEILRNKLLAAIEQQAGFELS